MPAYLKLEESIIDADSPLKNDCMGVSLLALLISPWAMLGLVISIMGYAALSTVATIFFMSVLLAATPKLLQLLCSCELVRSTFFFQFSGKNFFIGANQGNQNK